MPPRKKKNEPEPEENQSTGSSEETDDDAIVTVPFGDNPSETATLLLAAAEESGIGQEVVRTGTGQFYVPAGVAKKAGVEVKKDE